MSTLTVDSAAEPRDAGISRAASARAKRRRFLEWVAVHALAIAAAVFFAGPFVLLFLVSVMSDKQALNGALWPHPFEWHNYLDVIRKSDMGIWWRNTLIYSFAATVLMLLSSIPTAYALAKLRFRGRRLALMLVVSAMMLPQQVTIVPMYIFWTKQMHLGGTLWPLIIPLAFGDAFSIFLLRQFLLTIPKEYTDAAKVDGCGEWRTLHKVILPMIKPAIAAVSLFQFFYCWNDYFGPQIYTGTNPKAWTLSIGMETFKGAHHVSWNQMMAVNLLVTAPVVVVFFFAQKAFIEGVTLTGVKG
jgi:multiple sugar transport system permease protein